MGKFFGRVGVGMLVSLPITCIVAGGVNDGFMLLLASIICTAGIGLVVWIPAWWLLGWGTHALLTLLIAAPKTAEQPVGQTEQYLTPGTHHKQHATVEVLALEVLALRAYIKRTMEDGMEVEEMRRRLLSNGWESDEIERALQGYISTRSEEIKT